MSTGLQFSWPFWSWKRKRVKDKIQMVLNCGYCCIWCKPDSQWHHHKPHTSDRMKWTEQSFAQSEQHTEWLECIVSVLIDFDTLLQAHMTHKFDRIEEWDRSLEQILHHKHSDCCTCFGSADPDSCWRRHSCHTRGWSSTLNLCWCKIQQNKQSRFGKTPCWVGFDIASLRCKVNRCDQKCWLEEQTHHFQYRICSRVDKCCCRFGRSHSCKQLHENAKW